MGNQVDFKKTYQYIPFPPWLPVNTHIKEKNEMCNGTSSKILMGWPEGYSKNIQVAH